MADVLLLADGVSKLLLADGVSFLLIRPVVVESTEDVISGINEGEEKDTFVHYVAIPTTQEEVDASRPPQNSRMRNTKRSEAFDIHDTGF